MSQVLFFAVTAAQYAALSSKNADALYFVTDKNLLYKGDVLYSHPIEIVTSFPASGQPGVLYVHKTTFEAKNWNGTAWDMVALPVVTSIGASPTNAQLPSAQAVKSYLDAEIVKVNTGLSGAVSNVGFDAATKSLSVQKGAGEAVVTQLKGLMDGANYNGATGVLTFTTNGGTPITVTMPVEQFLSAAAYDETTHILTLTLNNNAKFEVNLADLVDTYSGGASNSVAVTIAGGTITAAAKISATAGNQLSVKADGLFAAAVDITGKMDKAAGTAGTLLSADAAGNATRTDKKVVTTLTNLDTDVPTAKAVTAALSWQTLA